MDPLHDAIARQYERYPYPPPIEDLEEWCAKRWNQFDPMRAHRTYWPDRDYKPDMDILVAGCGTSQAAQIAFTNPEATVIGIDVSAPSLAHGQYLKDRHELANLTLFRVPIEEVNNLLDGGFDLILATGVLHHLADPVAGLTALGSQLRPDSVISVMIYGKYGCADVETAQSVFRDLGLGQDQESIQTVREMITLFPARHGVHRYLDELLVGRGPNWHLGVSDLWIVDAFLNPRQRSYSVEECMALTESAGLVFGGWLMPELYTPKGSDVLARAIAGIGDEGDETLMWSLMERVNMLTGHCFVARHGLR